MVSVFGNSLGNRLPNMADKGGRTRTMYDPPFTVLPFPKMKTEHFHVRICCKKTVQNSGSGVGGHTFFFVRALHEKFSRSKRAGQNRVQRSLSS